MAKPPKKQDQIKQKAFKGRNITMLDGLKRDKNTVLNVFRKLGTGVVHPSSWFDECVPNLLWAAIVITKLERNDALQIFRQVVRDTIDHVEKRDELFISHNWLAIATPAEFDAMMAAVIGCEELKPVMPALLLTNWLPDREHWARHYQPIDQDEAANILMIALAETHGHQTQPATDLRWLKTLSYIFAQERMKFAYEVGGILDEISDYPNAGDMKRVRPSIRSIELMTRDIEFQKEESMREWPEDRARIPPYDAEPFWKEMHEKTTCLTVSEFKKAKLGPNEAKTDMLNISRNVQAHYHRTIETTKADARHEGAFGLVLYAFHLALTSAVTPTNTLAEGRIILRSILEIFITLHYLAMKDDDTIWLQYRKYGIGQTKLAFLKNVREEEVPDFIDLGELEEFANEDRWMEFQDIELGHWANLNLRKMSEESGVKDLYDKYYDWASGYVHAQWASARSTVFINCFNPLHRFHRIPGPLATAMPSILPDTARILNRMLDDLNRLYPAFKPRLTWHKKAESENLEVVLENDGEESQFTNERS